MAENSIFIHISKSVGKIYHVNNFEPLDVHCTSLTKNKGLDVIKHWSETEPWSSAEIRTLRQLLADASFCDCLVI